MSIQHETFEAGASGGTAPADDGSGVEVKARGYWEQVWRRFRQDRVAIMAGVFIVLTGVYCGFAMSYCKSLPFWNTGLLPIVFVIMGIADGLALTMGVNLITGTDDAAIGTLDTGVLHAETRALVTRLEAHYGLQVHLMQPAQDAVIRFVARNGERAMYRSIELRKACCAVRKLEPLSRLLAGRTAWVTGLRRDQSDHRAAVPFSERDSQGRLKLNPLADWTWGDVWHYIADNDVPYNQLHDQFYPSIGCAPCTRAIALGEDFRAGRWWWEDEAAKECGLHIKDAEGLTV